MRCIGAEDPPCHRCKGQGIDCVFERRSDYILKSAPLSASIRLQLTSHVISSARKTSNGNDGRKTRSSTSAPPLTPSTGASNSTGSPTSRPTTCCPTCSIPGAA